MFINFWASDHINNSHISFALLFHFFAKNIHTDYIFWICNANFFPNDFIQDIFQSFSLSDLSPNTPNESDLLAELKDYQILFTSRASILPKLSLRNAVIEDHDDILPILQYHHPHLFASDNKVLKENYFLANLINNQDSNNSFHVALHNNKIKGMISTSLDVNMSMLMKIFDIDSYPGLLLPPNDVPIPPPLIINIMGELRLLDVESVEELLVDNNCIFLNFEKIKMKEIIKKYDNDLTINEKIEKYIQEKINEVSSPEDIQAIVLWSFPSTEEDVELFSSYLLNCVNISLELLNVCEDEDRNQEEENDDDEILQSHLDAMECYRELYLHNSFEKKSDWRKIYYDSETLRRNKHENLTHFKSIFFGCLDERLSKLEIARTLNKEKPPKSNAFAITTLCLTEESLSRSIDLIQYCFELHTTLDYCLYIVDNKTVPGDMLSCFSLVSKRSGVSFDQNLYILHKSFFYMRDYMNIERVLCCPTCCSSLPSIDTTAPGSSVNVCSCSLSASSCSNSSIKEFLDRYYTNQVSQTNNNKQNKLLNQEINSNILKEYNVITKYLLKINEDSEVKPEENPSMIGFLLKLDDMVLGYIFLSRDIFANNSKEFNLLKKNYELESNINLTRHKIRSFYTISHFKIESNFTHFIPLFLQNIMRKCEKSILLFQINNNSDLNLSNSLSISLNFPSEFLYLFNFIKPKRLIEDFGENNNEVDEIEKNLLFNSLYYYKKSLSAKKKTLISTRIVIIGGSIQAQSIIETFSSINDTIYTNIYYIDEEIPSWGQCNGCLSPQDPDQLPLREFYANDFEHRINIINGKLTDIDRENKAVIISDKLVLEYDYLILSSSTHDYTYKTIPSLYNLHPLKCADLGVFGLGNMTYDTLASNWIEKKKNSKNDTIAVVGLAAYAFHTIETLIRDHNISPDKIVCILSESPYNLELCYDQTVSNALKNSSNWSNVTEIYWNTSIIDVNLNKSGFVQSIELNQIPIIKQDDSEEFFAVAPAKVNCGTILFCNGQKNISCDRDMFAAINDCGLVFDGGLIVDTQFRTVDPCIFGVSDYSKFSRIYKNKIPHKYLNSKEIGTYVAFNLLSKYFHPDILKFNEINKKNEILSKLGLSLIPNHRKVLVKNYLNQFKPLFTLPRTIIFRLSGNYLYYLSKLSQISTEILHFPTENHVKKSKSNQTCHNVVCFSIEPLGEIEILSVITQDFNNLKLFLNNSFVGQHESSFDSLFYNYKNGLINDWISYFENSAWLKIRKDNYYDNLMTMIYQTLQYDKDVYQLISRIFERVDPPSLPSNLPSSPSHSHSMMSSSVVYVNNDSDIEEIRKGMIGVHGQLLPSSTRKIIQDTTIEFVKKYTDLSQTYQIPKNHS